MHIYTRSGDEGQTSLIYGRRIDKDARRVDVYGTVDETNSVLGAALSMLTGDDKFTDIVRMGERVQRDLFDVGRDLATPEDKRDAAYIESTDVDLLERMIDVLWAQVPPLQKFILPGGHSAAAMLHVARTVARRAERDVVALSRVEPVNPAVRKYMNRLSDLLFAMARAVNARTGTVEPAVDFQTEKPDPLIDLKIPPLEGITEQPPERDGGL